MYRRRVALVTLLLMAGLAAILLVTACRAVRQNQLNQALITAVRHKDVPTVVTLLLQGADANARESNVTHLSLWTLFWDRLTGKTTTPPHAPTALVIACGHSTEAEANSPQQLAIVAALLAKGADVNGKDPDGDTPLIEAASCGSADTVRFLLAHGADIEARNTNGQTALLETAGYGYPEIIEMLLTHGANPAAKDNKGRGVLKIVRQGFDDAAAYRLLKHAGAWE